MHWFYISVTLIIIIEFSKSLQQPVDWDLQKIDNNTDQNMAMNNQTNRSQLKYDGINLFNDYREQTWNVSKLPTKESHVAKAYNEEIPGKISTEGHNATKDSTLDGIENIIDYNALDVRSVFGSLMQRVKQSGIHNDFVDLTHFYNFRTLDTMSNFSDMFLPIKWSNFCSVGIGQYKWNISAKHHELIYLHCKITEDNTWDFLSFRNLTRKIINFDFALDIKCTPETRISLPWPMRANLLKYISVEGCTIEKFESELYDETISSIPDTIEYLRIVDSQVMIYIDDLLDRAKNPKTQTQTADCGPTNSYMTIMKNISQKFDLTKTIPSIKHYPILSKLTKKAFRDLSLSNYVCNFKNLWMLDRSYCSSLGVQSDLLLIHNSRFPKLEVLNISHAMLNEIPDKLKDWRLYLPGLNYLDMSYNNISEFHIVKDYGSEWENPSIGTIDLSFNNITTITAKGIKHLARAKYFKVDLRNNPYNCICEMRNFVDFMKRNKNLTTVNMTNYQYFNTLTCANPPRVKSRIITKLNNEELGCEVNKTTVLQGPIIALSALLTILLAFFVIAVRYRKEITILAFTRLHIIIPCQHGTVDGNKQYDAFVAYSQHDAKWVLKILAPRLESQTNPNAFKLCLHHRDFALGAPISDNIIKSVELSRHTVLVISKNFLESEWCLLEFRTALQQSLLERKRHLIMILLEDVPTQEIDNDIKRCLQTLTYVKQDDRWFWDKLIYALSDKSRKNKQQKDRDIQLNHVPMPDRGITKENKIKDNAIRY